MASELLIRPGQNDHEVVANLLAPGAAAVLLPRNGPVVGRLVVDAQIAPQRPQFAEAAATAGIPCLVDPLTHLWQGELRPDSRWAKLPFGQAEELQLADLADPVARERLVADCVDFQVAHGATAVIPPYPYVSSPDDPWFERALELVRLTARYMRRQHGSLPIAPVLCGRRQTFAAPRNWGRGLDRFARTAIEVGPQFLGLCLSPMTARDSYANLLNVFAGSLHLRRHGVPVMAWRQGFYGPALVAAGVDGYETGIGIAELCDIRSAVRRRRPAPDGTKQKGGAAPGIFIETLGRSLPAPSVRALMAHRPMLPKVMCTDRRCCPNGQASTFDRGREHAVRTRARVLAALDAQPHRTWRLHQIAKDAQAAATLATQANDVLRMAGIKAGMATAGLESLAQVAEYLRSSDPDIRPAATA